MTDADRGIIVHNCVRCDDDKIIITHGTDTMVDTARAIAAAGIHKTIVLTGAMVPYAFGTSSDGFFNLGSASCFCTGHRARRVYCYERTLLPVG
jgi:L-asparaginase